MSYSGSGASSSKSAGSGASSSKSAGSGTSSSKSAGSGDNKNTGSTTVSCDDFDTSLSAKESISTFSYSVEASTSDASTWSSTLESAILSASAAVLLVCDSRSLRLRLLQEGSASSIGALSSDPVDSIISDTCSAGTGNSCTLMEGGMTIFYTSASADSTLYENELLIAIKSAMDSGILNDSAPGIISVKYLGPEPTDLAGAVGPEQGDDGSLDDTSKLFIIFGSVGIALLALVVVRRRSQRDAEDSVSDYSKSRIAMVVEDGYFDDDKNHVSSPGTVNTSLTGIPEGDEDDNSLDYRGPQYNDLGRTHSTLDVHRCSSATCTKCVERNQIQFIPTPRAPGNDDYSESSSI